MTMHGNPANFRTLKPEKVVETIGILEQRIFERFPQSGLRSVAAELLEISREAVVRADRIRRPNVPLQIASAVLIIAIFGLIAAMLHGIRIRDDLFEMANFLQSVEAGLGSVVFIGAGILFLATLDVRIKRHRVLKAMHELRALAHIVDMHQLTKDPESIVRSGPSTQSSPRRTMSTFELGRYLDYCSEMLSLISKLGAIYVQEFPDPVALDASDQLAALTNGLARNIWQKIMVLDHALVTTHTAATAPPIAVRTDPAEPPRATGNPGSG